MAEGKAVFHNRQDSYTCSGLNSGKSGKVPAAQLPVQPCPQCGSKKLYKAGLRYLVDSRTVQRWLCRNCGFRFSENFGKSQVKVDIILKKSESFHSAFDLHDSRVVSRNPAGNKPLKNSSLVRAEDVAFHNLTTEGKQLNSFPYKDSTRQVCESLTGSKNLNTATELKTVAGETRSIEGKILQYLVYLKNQGFRDTTIEQKDQLLRRLLKLGANLDDPETVKKAIANIEKTESYKLLLSIAYEGFAKRNEIVWTRPKYKQSSPLAFIPHESEIDQLIAGCSRKTGTFLRLLKETAMRLGEAWLIEWKDLDSQNCTVTCNNPEKNSRARIFQISSELTQMLLALPHNSQFVFTCSRQPLKKEDRTLHLRHLVRQKGLLGHQKERVSNKLKNPRILEIHYHTLRHWKATQLYHQTKDILYVMKFLGHRDIKNTLIYIDLETACYSNGPDEYHAKTARTETEVIKLVESGFEYVCSLGEAKLFRKRK